MTLAHYEGCEWPPCCSCGTRTEIVDDYTPTTTDVRDLFAHGRYATNDKSPRHRSDALFDRWLAEYREEVRADLLVELTANGWLSPSASEIHDRLVLEKAVERTQAAMDAVSEICGTKPEPIPNIIAAAIRGEASNG